MNHLLPSIHTLAYSVLAVAASLISIAASAQSQAPLLVTCSMKSIDGSTSQTILSLDSAKKVLVMKDGDTYSLDPRQRERLLGNSKLVYTFLISEWNDAVIQWGYTTTENGKPINVHVTYKLDRTAGILEQTLNSSKRSGVCQKVEQKF